MGDTRQAQESGKQQTWCRKGKHGESTCEALPVVASLKRPPKTFRRCSRSHVTDMLAPISRPIFTPNFNPMFMRVFLRVSHVMFMQDCIRLSIRFSIWSSSNLSPCVGIVPGGRGGRRQGRGRQTQAVKKRRPDLLWGTQQSSLAHNKHNHHKKCVKHTAVVPTWCRASGHDAAWSTY